MSYPEIYLKNWNYLVKQSEEILSILGEWESGENKDGCARSTKRVWDLMIMLFVQLWHLRNGQHDAHKADLISL